MTVYIQRIYEDKQRDGLRILVDRVWPRGISKDDANLDHWIKDVAPTSELRKWFNHDPKLYAAFKEKYEKELRDNADQKEAFEELQSKVSETDKYIILLFAAKDEKYNQAVVLQSLLQ
ncbi:DUF488 domain-containing protein [Staphylococcus shinii]|mgnify:CR=1 FL=1|uniref:DUF488 domain-containing protein n=1 Tax=Staphylococcus TaxID=1279 RepID=UPI002E193497|nr:DUF488 family protein [Staphylococcus shinii]